MILGTDSQRLFESTALDTSLFIYLIERHPVYADVVRPIFAAANRGECRLVTSAVTLLEVLIVPYRLRKPDVAVAYEDLLMRSRGVEMIDIDTGQLRVAAELRANFGLKTPDALQIAAALTTGCSSFITNDKRLPEIPGLSIVQLSQLP